MQYRLHPFLNLRPIVLALILGLTLGPPMGWANDKAASQVQSQAATSTEAQTPKQESKGEEAIRKERKKLVEEAVTALRETEHALKALSGKEPKPQEALEALSTVIGKLGIILARDPELKFVPVDVEVMSLDLISDIDKVQEAIKDAQEYLEEGEIQKARRLLSSLGSELVITTLSLPLATYPDAIQAIVPLIDEGKYQEARDALEAVLNTLVVTNRVIIPLPILRAEYLIQQAETLAKELETPKIESAEKAQGTQEASAKEASPKDKKAQIQDLLKQAHQQLRLAEVLGYGLEEKQYEDLHAQIRRIEQKIGAEEATQGLFAKLRNTLSRFTQTFLGGEE